MLGPPKSRELDRSVVTSLEQLVPADHFYRHLDATLDLSFVRDWVADLYAPVGRPSIDPIVFFKLQLILFFEGYRSERQLMSQATLNLAHRWYVGYNLDEILPDHSSLTRIRQRLGLDLFRRFFEHVVELCDEAGLIWGKELLVDATKVPANAADSSIVPRLREVIDDHLVELFAQDEVDSDQGIPSSANSKPSLLYSSPSPGSEGDCDRETEEMSRRWDLLDTCRLEPDRPLSQGYERVSNRKVSRTDPDATLITMPDKRTVLGYQTHYMMDGGRARIILHALTMPGDVMENQPFLDQLRRVCFRWRLHPDRVIADTKYSTIENIKTLDAMGITAYMPLRDWEHKTEYFGASHFTYDSDQKALRKRRVWVELLFAEANQWHGLDRFRLRGLWRVNTQTLPIAAGQNLKRYLAARGWGQRHGPMGSLWASTEPIRLGVPWFDGPRVHQVLWSRLALSSHTLALDCYEEFFNTLS